MNHLVFLRPIFWSQYPQFYIVPHSLFTFAAFCRQFYQIFNDTLSQLKSYGKLNEKGLPVKMVAGRPYQMQVFVYLFNRDMSQAFRCGWDAGAA